MGYPMRLLGQLALSAHCWKRSLFTANDSGHAQKTGRGIGAFIGSCKNIRRLDLSGCDQIKDSGLDGEYQVWRCYKHH